MEIVEYKKHLVNGKTVNPEWIIVGGFLPDLTNKTYIGFCLTEDDRDYYIPDTVTFMTRAEVVQRSVDLHNVQPYKINTDMSDSMSPLREMTEKDIADMIDNIIDSVHEEY